MDIDFGLIIKSFLTVAIALFIRSKIEKLEKEVNDNNLKSQSF